jgi:hypothetical protein
MLVNHETVAARAVCIAGGLAGAREIPLLPIFAQIRVRPQSTMGNTGKIATIKEMIEQWPA